MSSRLEREAQKSQNLEIIRVKPLTYGLYGEALGFLRPAERHTNGAKAALKAQKI